MSTVKVHYDGNLFSNANAEIVAKMRREIVDAVAAEAERTVRDIGQGSFRYLKSPPTGKWSKSLHTEESGDDRIVTTDIIYGPWLEGVGSRNESTRFKGYRMFRRTTQRLQRGGSERIANPIIDRAVREFNS